MPRAKAAPRAAAPTASLAALLSPARAEASRRNGARSKGPKTPEGKARSAQNALKHGLRAEKFVVVGDEDPQQFAALEAALTGELAPEGALQTLLAGRVVRAAWRLARADQIEAEMFAREMRGPFGDGDLGLALIRDGNGARAFDTLLRYRGATLAEFSRALRMLKALQAEASAVASRQDAPEAPQDGAGDAPRRQPNQPEARADAGDSRAESGSVPAPPVGPTTSSATTAPALAAPAAGTPAAGTIMPGGRAALCSQKTPIEPEGRGNPGGAGGFDARGAAARAA